MNENGWSETAKDYERMFRPLTSQFAAKALDMIKLETSKPAIILDVACGTGALCNLAAAKFKDSQNVKILATDYAQGMIDIVSNHASEHNLSNLDAKVMDATDMHQLKDYSVDVAFCIFGVMLIPQCEKALSEIYRVLKPGKQLVIATWSSHEFWPWMSGAMNAAAGTSVSLSHANQGLEAGQSAATTEVWTNADFNVRKVKEAGFENVISCLEERTMMIPDLDQFLTFSLGNPVLKSKIGSWTHDQVMKFKTEFKRLVFAEKGEQKSYTWKSVAILTTGTKHIRQ